MTNRLRNGLQWLSAKLNECCSENVVYTQGSVIITVPALFGQTKYQTTSEFGQTTGSFLVDFLIRFADLGFYPELGDRILAEGRQYEVMELGDEGTWRWSDPYGIRLRVHTKMIKENL